MAERIELPPMLQGDENAQLQQLWSYLYQVSEAINNNLQAIGGNELTDSDRQVMNKILGEAGEKAAASGEMETLKSLIIKTADFVQTNLQEYRMNLLGESVSSGQFGRYVRHTGLDVAVTPEGITQNYSFEEVVQGLKQFSVNAKNYIKTGLLRTVGSEPVYGVAIGKDVVTFSNDGTETYHDGNKVAELTADELSFWQNGVKIASYKGSQLSFLIGSVERMKVTSDGVSVMNGNTKLTELLNGELAFYSQGNKTFYIESGKLYCTGNMDITGSRSIRIFTSNNSQYWQFNHSGMIFNKKINGADTAVLQVAHDDDRENGVMSGIFADEQQIQQDQRTFQFLRFYLRGTNGYNIIIDNYFDVNDVNHSEALLNLRPNTTRKANLGIPEAMWRQAWIDETHVDEMFPHGNASGSIGGQDIQWLDAWIWYVHAVDVYQSSSRDIKHDIQPMEETGGRLDRLQPVSFIYDNDPEERRRYGLIYEDTIGVMPEICSGKEYKKEINYVQLIPVLLKEIQELRARVKALEERGGNEQ